MNKELEKAINKLNYFKKVILLTDETGTTNDLAEAIETVLNHLDYYQEKIEKYKFMFQNDVIPKKRK